MRTIHPSPSYRVILVYGIEAQLHCCDLTERYFHGRGLLFCWKLWLCLLDLQKKVGAGQMTLIALAVLEEDSPTRER